MSARVKKSLGTFALHLLLALLVLIAVLAGLAGTESALQWGARQAESLSDGKLTFGAVHGSLYGPLRVEALSFQSDAQRIELKQLELDWAPRSLFVRQLRIDRLSLEELRVIELRPSTEPVTLPESLRLPLNLSIPAVEVERVVFRRGDAENVLRNLRLSVDRHADTYTLNLRNLDSEWGKASAELTLGDTRPFDIKARASLNQAKDLAYQSEVEASGNLTQLLLTARLSALDGQAEIKAGIAPFDEFPIVEASLKASGMNPAVIDKSWPKASLAADVVVKRHGKDSLEGSLALRNTLSGHLDQSRLPLRELATRFAGSLARIDLSAIQLDMGEAGQFSGAGQIEGEQVKLKLATSSFNPAGAHGKLNAMHLAGELNLQTGVGGNRLVADLRDKLVRLHLDALHRDGVLELREVTARAASGSLSLKGRLALESSQAFQLTGLLRKFNPAEFGDYPAAGVNASISASGQLASTPEARLEFSVADSHFRNQPLSGQGRLNVTNTRIWNSDLMLQIAGNRLEVKGAMGAPADRLVYKVDAVNLALIDPQLGGQGHAEGTLEGRFSDPSGTIDAVLDNLSWRKQFRVTHLHAKGHLEKGAEGGLALSAKLRGLFAPQLKLDLADIQIDGTRVKHSLKLLAKNPKLDLVARLDGGWHAESGWKGKVVELSNRGAYPLALSAPAKLEVAKDRALLGNAHFDIGDAKFVVHELAYKPGEILSRGEFRGFAADYLRDLAGKDASFETDLMLAGNWQLTVGDSVNGRVALWRERGDVSFSGLAQTSLGLDQLALNVDAVNNRLQGRLEASGKRLGRLKLQGESLLSLHGGVWGMAGDAPIQADADLSIDSLAWLRTFIGGAADFEGALKAQLNVGGSFAQPLLTGSASGDRFALSLPDLGLNIREGRFRAELRDQILYLDELTLRGGKGSLSGQGQMELKNGSPVMQLTMKADALEVLSRPDRHLIVSGSGEASLAGKQLQIEARLKADRGLIELPRADAPALSDDIVVLGRSAAGEKKGRDFVAKLNLDVDLGEKFFVKGKGLDAQLGGSLSITGEGDGLPSARGSIRVVKGAYSAYGQRLEIERGIVNFQGPIDNPGLNIVALRKNQPVEAGVSVTGTAQSPAVRLVSNPSVPDSEKLSWLVLGHGFEDSSDKEFGALQAAAGALLATGESVSLQQSIAHGAGLEEVSLKGGGGLESAVLSLGKRLSSRAYLSFEQGLVGATTLIKVNYTLTERISVRAQAGTTPAVDLFYTYSFD